MCMHSHETLVMSTRTRLQTHEATNLGAPTASIDRISDLGRASGPSYMDGLYIDFFCFETTPTTICNAPANCTERSRSASTTLHAHGRNLHKADSISHLRAHMASTSSRTTTPTDLHCIKVNCTRPNHDTKLTTSQDHHRDTQEATSASSTRQAGVERDAIFIDFFGTTRHRHFVAVRDAFKRHITVDTPLQRHRRYFIGKVFINVVFTSIFVNTPPLSCPQDGHLASSDRLFCKTRPRRRHRPRHPRRHDCIDTSSLQ
ncbi:hypothetical protein VPH35_028436 [Triticum aestivum]